MLKIPIKDGVMIMVGDKKIAHCIVTSSKWTYWITSTLFDINQHVIYHKLYIDLNFKPVIQWR